MFLFRNRIVVDGIRIEGAAARKLMRDALGQANMDGQSNNGFRELFLAIAFFIFVVPVGLLLPRVPEWFPSFPVYLLPGAAGFGVSLLVGAWWRWTHKRAIRRAMQSVGYELCENCGYWLRGLSVDVKQCPECGAHREPMPRAPEDHS